VLDSFDRAARFAPLVLRLFLAVFLVYKTQDNVFSSARMQEFEGFLAANGFPAPAVCARLSVYAQFACGILIALGALTRWAALAMIGNFVVAILGVHVGLPFDTYLEPSAMLACSIALLLTGAGPFSVDGWLAARVTSRESGS